MVGGADSAFLQQAAHLTGGLYLRPLRAGGLLQTLLVRLVQWGEKQACMQLLPRRPGRVQGRRQHTDADRIPVALQTVFCAETYSRGFLDLPQATGVDFRASCFCHKVAVCALHAMCTRVQHACWLWCWIAWSQPATVYFALCTAVLRQQVAAGYAVEKKKHLSTWCVQQRAIDLGYVCSVCLSIFCQVSCCPDCMPLAARLGQLQHA